MSYSNEPSLQQLQSTTVYGSATAGQGIPYDKLAEGEMPARLAYRFVHDELEMDGNPALNLASFVTTYMEDEAEKLMTENLKKNFIDLEEYPACAEIESRCAQIIADLFNAPDVENDQPIGVSTIGSSEAIILSVLAAKRRWQHARKALGKPCDKPNLVMNAAVQVCWEKAARYLEIEERYWNTRDEVYIADPKELIDLVDENTIMVCAILGTTYTGQYEDVAGIAKELEIKNKTLDNPIYIHVDAASGGFVAPFVNPDLVWDFRIPLVASINTSGHKYGLAYAGVGWNVWRNRSLLPHDILFTVNYLGSPQVSFTLNFSKSAVQVIGQYYIFLRLGRSGYTAIMQNLTRTADHLANHITAIGDGKKFTLISSVGGEGLPLVAFKLTEKENYDEFEIARRLRSRGWIVPAYTMAPKCEKTKLMRVVVREDFSMSRCDHFINDLISVVETLDKLPSEVLDAMAYTSKQDATRRAHSRIHNHSHRQPRLHRTQSKLQRTPASIQETEQRIRDALNEMSGRNKDHGIC